MAYRIERKGNYFKLTDNVTGVPQIERPAHSLFYRDNKENQRVWFYFGNPNVVLGDINGYGLDELVDIDDNIFTSYTDLIDWLDNNTGSNQHLTNGAVDVILQDPTTPLLIVPLSNITNETTITSVFSRGDYDITVADPTGFIIDDIVTVYNLADNRVFFSHTLSVLGNVVTLSMPSDFDFAIGSFVTVGSTNMNVDGSVTPKVFGVRNPSNQDIPLRFDISRMMFKILADSSITLEKFGDIAGGILRGVLVRRVDGEWQNLFHWKTNAELKNLCFDLDIQAALGNQQDGLTARFTFGGQGKLGSVIRIGANEDLQIIIQDDLSSLSTFRAIAEGSVVDD